ncbi:unnamed protein product, partial [Leptidea sinapis]
ISCYWIVFKPTASRVVKKVTEAIAQLRPRIIKFPDDLSTLQNDFYEIARFPRVIGAIDCTHTRNTVERCFGVCKNGFPVLRRQVTLKLKQIQAVIVACFVLHNIAIDFNVQNFGNSYDPHIDMESYEEMAGPSHELNNNTRNRL